MNAEGLTKRRAGVPAGAAEPISSGGVVVVANKRVQRRRSWEAIIAAVTCFILVRLAIRVFLRYDMHGFGLQG